jgi:site-specific recombinase XerD
LVCAEERFPFRSEEEEVMVIEGPLAPWATQMIERLDERGYSPYTARQHVARVAKLSRFLEERGLQPNEVTPVVLEQFCFWLPRRRKPITPKTFVWLTEFLSDVGMAPAPGPELPPSPGEVLIERYRRFMLDERALEPATVVNYVRSLRVFLGEHADCPLKSITPADVSRFMTRQCRWKSPRGLERMATSLRSFFRFALVVGLISVPLDKAVPSAARWSAAGLPRGLAPEQVAALLASCDRATPVGRRDYAILLLLARLGLRAAEAAVLRLEDIDWRAGEIVVRGKGHIEERLPLPADVGAALAVYLRQDRPRRPEREVFLRASAPLRGLAPQGLSEVVRAASERARIGSFGAHRLRHTAGTQMLRAGASLTEVAQVLRHRRVATTAIYAKVDHQALRTLAQPWPGHRR